jgi:PTH1 family peptidyl-tRNA hydrolase
MDDNRWLIVGLGNPGREYSETRHNVGFMVIDKLWDLVGYSNSLKTDAAYKAELALSMFAGKKIILAKPLTFMNDSGFSVAQISKWYNIPIEKILIIYDDISLDFGRLRYRVSGSAGGHNGIKSIISSLNNDQNFPRLKIGIGPKPPEEDLINYVLGNFNSSENDKLPEIINNTISAINLILNTDPQQAMTKINK